MVPDRVPAAGWEAPEAEVEVPALWLVPVPPQATSPIERAAAKMRDNAFFLLGVLIFNKTCYRILGRLYIFTIYNLRFFVNIH